MSTGTVRQLPLYQLGAELLAIADQMVEEGGVLSPQLEAELAALEGAFEQKVESIALLVRQLMQESDAAQREATRLLKLVHQREATVTRLKHYLQAELERVGLSKVKSPLVTVTVAQNSRPTIRWLNTLEALPEAFRRVSYSLDGEAAYEAYTSRGVLPAGFVVERGKHLRII